MKKMDGKTMDIVAENIGKLKELFPEAFTEDGSDYGTTKDTKSTKINFEVLKELLGEYVTDKDERYSFTWNGKSKARMIAQTSSTGTLRPCKEESVDWDTTKNIFIEGDNLEVLKLLQKSYHKKVKMIYIDPPYNTGKDFVYKDNFKDNIKNYKEITSQVDGEGRNLSNNPETSGRYHTDWLNMMYPRLKLARNLLKDDGVIFISIDDNEVSNLRKICDEIFGEENFSGEFIWKKKQGGGNDSNVLVIEHEYIISYSKNIMGFMFGLDKKYELDSNLYPFNDENGEYGLVTLDKSSIRFSDSLVFEITDHEGNIYTPRIVKGKQSCWRWGKKKVEEDYDQLVFKNGKVYTKYYRPEGITPKSLLVDTIYGRTETGNDDIKSLFENNKPFSYPKPLSLITHLITIGTETEDIILDFFAGSATSAHALMQQNAEDNGNRKFIMVQLPEPCDKKSEAFKAGYKTIAEISKERIRRAAAKIREELTTKDTKSTKKEEGDLFAEGENFRDVRAFRGSKLPDLGFKVFKLDSTNIKPWEVDFDLTERTLEDFISNIKTDRREEDVLYEVLLKYGLDLTLPITEHNIAGQKVFDIGIGALIICLSDAISLEVVEGIAKLKDELNPEIMRVVFKDSGFKDDVVKTNAVQILRQAGIVDVRSL